MKRIIFNLIFCGSFAVSVSAQSWKMTEDTHGLNPIEGTNEMILTEISDPGESGLNVIWDFSGIKFLGEFTGTIKNVSDPETKEKFNETTIVLEEFKIKYYYKYINGILEECGIQEGENCKTTYSMNTPPVKSIFPLGYGDAYSKEFEGTQTVDSYTRSLNGTTSIDVDGFGTLKLPFGTINNVLRVKSTKSYDNVLNGEKTHFNITTHRWYAINKRYPLLVCINICTNNTNNSYMAAYTKKYTPKNMDKTESVDNRAGENLLFEVHPNPVNDVLKIDYKLGKEEHVCIEIFNIQGKKLYTVVDKKQAVGFYTEEVNVKNIRLLPGVHYIRLNIKVSKQNISRQIVVN